MQASSDHINQNFTDSILGQVIHFLKESGTLKEKLSGVCNIIQQSFADCSPLSIQIAFEGEFYKGQPFKKSGKVNRFAPSETDTGDIFFEVYFEPHKKASIDTTLMDRFFRDLLSLIHWNISNGKLSRLTHENTERLKELKGIRRTAEILTKENSIEKSLKEICSFLPEAWQFPEFCAARIRYCDKEFTSRNFKDTPWVQKRLFETPDNQPGSIEIFYLKEFPLADEGPFLKEERDLIDNLSALISGTVSKRALGELLVQNTERLKELRGINQTSAILKESKSTAEALKYICTILPDAYQYPEYTAARIQYEGAVFTSKDFSESEIRQVQEFDTPKGSKGIIEVFYKKDFPAAGEGPFLKEERQLLINLANLIAGSATKDLLSNLLYENRERLKELHVINHTSYLISQGRPIDETLQKICYIMPRSWQFSRYTTVRITYDDRVYYSREFKDTPWRMQEKFVTFDNKQGSIEVFYLKEFPNSFEGPFLKEERQLIINLGKLISGYINNFKGKEIYGKTNPADLPAINSGNYRQSLVKNKRPLQLFFNQQSLDKYIYLDMMKYKVKEILFVATLYDAFILENEDSFFEQFMGIIYQYSLFSLPRITGVTTSEEALELLDSAHFDIVILMVGIDKETPLNLSEQIKQKRPSLPVYMLLNQKSNIKYFEDLVPTMIR